MAVQTNILREEYQDLDWVVQVNTEVCRRWESMAAFNVRSIATGYAEKAKKANPLCNYRVIELSKLQPTYAVIFETEAAVSA